MDSQSRSAVSVGEFADYKAAAGTLEFGPDDFSRQFIISLIDDAELENNEDFLISLDNVVGGAALGGGRRLRRAHRAGRCCRHAAHRDSP